MEILRKNIEEIQKYNPRLADDILNHTITNGVTAELIQAQSGDVNLLFNNIAVHNDTNPQEEALLVFKKATDISELSITVILGLGLGYLFKRATMSSNGKIIVYEPNLDILRLTLEIVDFSAELQRDNVFITNCETDFISFLNKSYTHNACINLLALSSAASLYTKEVDYLRTEFPKIRMHLESNYQCMFEKSFLWANEGIKNLPLLMNTYNLDNLKGAFKDRPAIIVSSGPSLDKYIDVLAENKDKALIFSVGNAYRALEKYNIKPDFLTFIEVHGGYKQVSGLDLKDINIIAQPIVNNGVLKLEAKRKFIFYSNNDLFSRWLSEPAQLAISDFETKGTVSYCALYSAFMMGCNPIILLGQDLAYTDGKCYSSNSAYGAVKFIMNEQTGQYEAVTDDINDIVEHFFDAEEMKLGKESYQHVLDIVLLSKINSNITYVNGQNGEKLPTDINYASFIKFFEEFAYNNSNLNLINSSTGGAKIGGFKDIPLNEILETLPAISIQTDAIIETITSKALKLNNNQENIKNTVESLIQDIEKYEQQVIEGLETSKKLINELSKTKFDVQKISQKCNNLINLYIRLKEKLFSKHTILTGCVFKELFEISKLLEYGTQETGLNDLLNIANASKNLYEAYIKNVSELKLTAKEIFKKN